MKTLVLLRHGESLWNLENKFTGWEDVDLSEKGIVEAHNAGKLLKKNGFSFDIAFSSLLKRAIRTLWISLMEMDLMWIPVEKSWKLNERHYGALEGLNKAETAKKYGDKQLHIWRRSYDVSPPAISFDDPRFPGNDPKYGNIAKEFLPLTECLEDTYRRVIPYCHEVIFPQILEGKKVIIAAHGNTLRALVKYLDNISDIDISDVNIPTGTPLVYELDENLIPLKHYYLNE